MVEGIVLAGGYSSRFKSNKMEYLINNQPIIKHTVSTMKTVCQKVIVVTGHFHEEIVQLFKNDSSVTIIHNSDYSQGMYSSVKLGVSQMERDFFIIPGDFPYVEESVYRNILQGSKSIRVPGNSNRLGHPIFISLKHKEDILSDKYDNLKSFRDDHDFEVIQVESDSILRDIDKISDVDILDDKELI
jgi:molybdenum cofactor cytidylyltransferase